MFTSSKTPWSLQANGSKTNVLDVSGKCIGVFSDHRDADFALAAVNQDLVPYAELAEAEQLVVELEEELLRIKETVKQP